MRAPRALGGIPGTPGGTPGAIREHLLDLPPFPERICRTGPMVHGRIQATALERAGGLDGWRVADMCQWSSEGYAAVAHFLNGVEDKG